MESKAVFSFVAQLNQRDALWKWIAPHRCPLWPSQHRGSLAQSFPFIQGLQAVCLLYETIATEKVDEMMKPSFKEA